MQSLHKRLSQFLFGFFLLICPQLLFSDDIQKLKNEITESFDKIADQILLFSDEEQTIDNAIALWQQYMEKIIYDARNLMIDEAEVREMISEQLSEWLKANLAELRELSVNVPENEISEWIAKSSNKNYLWRLCA